MSNYWKDNNIKKPQQIVVCAACKVGDVIFCGARHMDKVMQLQAHSANVQLKFASQGFIDQFGDFLTREEAMKVVKESGQPFNVDRNQGDYILFSEGLY